jgi:hypothetical protein
VECDDGEVDRNRIEREEGGRVGEEGGREGGRDLRMMRGGRAELRSSSSPADVKGKTAKGVLSSHASPFRFHPPLLASYYLVLAQQYSETGSIPIITRDIKYVPY